MKELDSGRPCSERLPLGIVRDDDIDAPCVEVTETRGTGSTTILTEPTSGTTKMPSVYSSLLGTSKTRKFEKPNKFPVSYGEARPRLTEDELNTVDEDLDILTRLIVVRDA